MSWTSIGFKFEEEGVPDLERIEILRSLALEMKPNKSPSSIWERTGPKNIFFTKHTNKAEYYEILIPDIPLRKIEILKDLGYELHFRNLNKKQRRSNFKRLQKNGKTNTSST